MDGKMDRRENSIPPTHKHSLQGVITMPAKVWGNTTSEIPRHDSSHHFNTLTLTLFMVDFQKV